VGGHAVGSSVNPLIANPTELVTFEHLPMAGMLLDLQGTVLAANAAMRGLLGTSAEQIVGRRLESLVTRGLAELMDTGHHQRSLIDELELQTAQGPRTLEVVISCIQAGDTHVVQLFGVDVTSRKREIATSARERAESLGIVAGGIAHDFNNLLVGVLAESSSAREDASLPLGVHDSLRRIESAARKMSQLTRSMLAYAGRGRVEAVRMDPDGVIGEMQEQLLRIVTAPAKLSLQTNAGRVAIEADASLIKQMIANLVANAAEAKGSLVEVETRVVMRGNIPWWQLEVSDDGEGIQETALPHIFEPFFTTKKDQTGLGLSAIQGIVRRLGGDIEVDSSPNRGARFRVRLPVLAGVEAPVRKTSAEGQSPIAKLTGARILVADDEPSVRTTVRRLLERRGASVELAVDGSDAESKLADGEYQLLILDVSMPGRTGYDVLATARRVVPHVPVMLMSGYTEQARGAGGERPDGFLEKPFTARTLDTLIDQVMRDAASKQR
jgi:PAS domain S-box-containing protein